jgi:hypothetical protein
MVGADRRTSPSAMSIQPNRVVARIIDQVDRSEWPPLDSRVVTFEQGDRWLRVFVAPRQACHATPIHFWVHALRDELSATGRRADLVGAAGHALCRKTAVPAWIESLRRAEERAASGGEALAALIERVSGHARAELYRMLESECRRSSVLDGGDFLAAEFWGHGAGSSWRVSA